MTEYPEYVPPHIRRWKARLLRAGGDAAYKAFEEKRQSILSRPDAFDEAMAFYLEYSDRFPFEFDMHFPVQWRYRQLYGPRK